MNKLKSSILVIIGIAVAIGLLSLLLPLPPDTTFISFNVNLGISLAMATFFIGAAFLFIKGLQDFTPRLKRAYFFICAGMALFAIAEIQLPVTILLGAQNSLVGLSIIPLVFATAIIILFVGTRSLAKLFDVKNLTTSWLFGISMFVVLAGIAVFIPHAPVSGPEYEFQIANVLIFFMITMLLMSAGQLLYIKQTASSLYANAFAWMFVGLISIVITGLTHFTFTIIAGDAEWYTVYLSPALIPTMFSFAGLCMIRSAYSFNLITKNVESAPGWTAHTFFGKPLHPMTQTTTTSVDIVTYAANLASNLQAIDSALEQLREVSARLKPGQTVTDQDETDLLNIYLKIEQHLLTEEKIRVFEKNTLRQGIAQGLALTADHPSFWTKLPH